MANVIKRHITAAPADGYAAFYYEWENITVRRKYGGKHNGFVGDGYNHSSENPEMQDDFQNMEHEWVYRVLFYGSEDEITNKEREILKSNDARNSSEWYNLTNGGTAYDVSKNQQIKFIVDSIKNGEWLQDTELGKSEIQKLLEGGIQVRINSSDPKFTKHISTLIDDKGDTSNTNPLVLVEHIKREGRLINGNTTGQATIDSKHGKKLKWQLIPKLLKKDVEYINTNHKRDFIHVADVCRAIIKVATQSFTGVIDVGTGVSRSLQSIVDKVGLKNLKKQK